MIKESNHKNKVTPLIECHTYNQQFNMLTKKKSNSSAKASNFKLKLKTIKPQYSYGDKQYIP